MQIKIGAAALMVLLCAIFTAIPYKNSAQGKKINILLITADDLNCSSVGAYGCGVENITPNLDQLANEGMMFLHSHVNIAVCQPSRGVLATGKYSHNSGIEGFFHTEKEIPTIVETLKDNGYLTGILGKVGHSSPKAGTPWDMKHDMPELGMGRNKDLYYKYLKQFFKKAKESGQPFYLMANSHDPHRPFAKSDDERRWWKDKNIKDPSRIYEPQEVEVPGFLPDIPNVRLEVSEYYSSVKRMDETVGKILLALEEEGLAESTVVMFLSDHGMAFPFSKTNCYLHSTKTPWIVRWPGVIAKNQFNRDDFISAVDFFPTVLDILKIEQPKDLDGESFKDVLEGRKHKKNDLVFTQFHETSAANVFPMRCVQNKKFGYIFNAWSDGERAFRNESQHGRSWKAMKQAAENNREIAQRVELFSHRLVEEFYDFEKDPDALTNLIDHPDYQAEIKAMRKELRRWMRRTNDPILDAFDNRNNPIKREYYVLELQKIAKQRKALRQNKHD